MDWNQYSLDRMIYGSYSLSGEALEDITLRYEPDNYWPPTEASRSEDGVPVDSGPFQYSMGFVISGIILLSIAGNLSVFITIASTRSLHRINNVLTISLALSDLLRAVITMPLFTLLLFTDDVPPLPSWICPVYRGARVCFDTALILNLTLISLERVFLIVRPLKYIWMVTRTKAGLAVVFLWLFVLTYGVLHFFCCQTNLGKRSLALEPLSTEMCKCRPDSSIYAWYDLLLCFVLPLCIMVISYGKILSVVSRHMQKISPTVVLSRDSDESADCQRSIFPFEPRFRREESCAIYSTSDNRTSIDTSSGIEAGISSNKNSFTKDDGSEIVRRSNSFEHKLGFIPIERGNGLEVFFPQGQTRTQPLPRGLGSCMSGEGIRSIRKQVTGTSGSYVTIPTRPPLTSFNKTRKESCDRNFTDTRSRDSREETFKPKSTESSSNQADSITPANHLRKIHKPNVNELRYSKQETIEYDLAKRLDNHLSNTVSCQPAPRMGSSKKMSHCVTLLSNTQPTDYNNEALHHDLETDLPDPNPTVQTPGSSTTYRSKTNASCVLYTGFPSGSSSCSNQGPLEESRQRITSLQPLTPNLPGVSSFGRLTENKAVRMMAVLVGAFILSWLPLETCHVIRLFSDTRPVRWVWDFADVMAFLASAINPLIYNFYSSEFRRAVRKTMRKCFGSNRKNAN